MSTSQEFSVNKLGQKGVVHLLLPIILILGLIAGVYLVTSGNPLKLFSKASNPPIVFKSADGTSLPLNSNGIPQATSANVRVELTSTLGAPISVSGPVSGPNTTGTVSYRTAFNPTDLGNAVFTPYTTEPTIYNISFPTTTGVQYYWVEFKATDGRVDRRSAQIELVSITSTPAPSVSPAPVFRLYNRRNGDHLFTVSSQEKDSALRNGYISEGTGFYALFNPSTDYSPVYRFYYPRTGEHFYTANQNEANTVTRSGFTGEGIAFYASTVSRAGLVPVYRFISRGSNFHFYTASESEKNSLVSSRSFRLEGIAFYTPVSAPIVPPSPTPAPTVAPTPRPVTSKRVFVTSTTYNGNLGGLTGADSKCQARANAANLGGSWKAWLADAANSPQTTFNKFNGPYKRIDGVIVANSWKDLTDGSLQNGINITEIGRTSYNNTLWANTSYYGGPGGPNCKSWRSALSTDSGTGATAGVTTSDWAGYGVKQCTSNMPLYCFEQ